MHRDQAPLLEPCDAPWEDMSTLEAGARWCQRCQRSVHDLSAMHLAQVETLLADERTQFCVRYAWDEDGEMLVFRPAPLVRLRAQPAQLELDAGMQLSSVALLVPGAMVP